MTTDDTTPTRASRNALHAYVEGELDRGIPRKAMPPDPEHSMVRADPAYYGYEETE